MCFKLLKYKYIICIFFFNLFTWQENFLLLSFVESRFLHYFSSACDYYESCIFKKTNGIKSRRIWCIKQIYNLSSNIHDVLYCPFRKYIFVNRCCAIFINNIWNILALDIVIFYYYKL